MTLYYPSSYIKAQQRRQEADQRHKRSKVEALVGLCRRQKVKSKDGEKVIVPIGDWLAIVDLIKEL